MAHLIVKALPIVDRATLSEEDQEVPETTTIAVNDSVPTEHLANAALDVFHTYISVDELEAFEFEVWNHDCRIFEAHDAENGQYANEGSVVG